MATEKRMIDVTEPLKLFRGLLKQLELPEDAGDKRGVESCIDILEDEPTVDAVEVVHGRWEWLGPYRHNDDGVIGTCSICKERLRLFARNYCPNCGAKMDGKT